MIYPTICMWNIIYHNAKHRAAAEGEQNLIFDSALSYTIVRYKPTNTRHTN